MLLIKVENVGMVAITGIILNLFLFVQEVVDCPEFLVYFPALEKLAERYGLMLIGKQKFANYFKVICHLLGGSW